MSKADSLLTCWIRIWGASALMDAWQQPTCWPSEVWRFTLVAAVVLANLWPSASTLALAMLVQNGCRMARLPFIWDSEMWGISADAAVALGMLLTVRLPDRDDVAMLTTAPTITLMLGVFYFAAGFWKINTAFLSSRNSCGSIFTASLLGQMWPSESWGPPPTEFAKFVVQIGPVLTIAGECIAGILALIPLRASKLAGLVAMILLHVGISFTAYPNGIANFSYAAATRYYFFMPESTSETLLESMSIPRTWAGYLVRSLAVCIIAAAWHYGTIAGPQHMGAVFFATLGVLYIFALPRELKRPAAQQHSMGAYGWLLILLVSFSVFGSQVLGLQDISAPASPFSSIRVHGGSNHLILPTGLLQQWAANESARDNAFAGGVVRVEYTDCVWINSLFPSDHSEALREDIVDILQRGGHSGRQFNPTSRRILGPTIRAFMPRWSPGKGPFVRYTIPAMELRRVIGETLAAKEACSIVYTKLAGGVVGDETWRAAATGPRVEVSLDNNGTETCTVDGMKCESDELALLPDIGFVHSRVHIFFPHPIISGTDGELPCMD
mmetsp:Transcript_52104/g.96470  ORF Transcript_52104/g.96470 Transcript_52104/m.96470 type:complete len:554 (-) Transcript_52104:56-1717(-)